MHTSLPSPTPHPFPALPHSRPRSPSFPVSSPLILGPLYLQIISMRARAGNDGEGMIRVLPGASRIGLPFSSLPLPYSQIPNVPRDSAWILRRFGQESPPVVAAGVLDIESGERSFVCLGRCSFPRSKSYMTERHTLWHVLCA